MRKRNPGRCYTAGVRALEVRMAEAEDNIDSLIVKDGRYGKVGRSAYWEIKRLRKELDKAKKQ